MFDQQNKFRQQKNWKIINRNFKQVKQINKDNRSSIIEQGGKYNPKKSLSKQKIFQKSKQRLNLTNVDNNTTNPMYLKGITRDFTNKPILNNNYITTPNSKRMSQKIEQHQQTQNYRRNTLNQQKSLNITNQQVREQYCHPKRNHCRNGSVSFQNNSEYSFNANDDSIKNLQLHKQNNKLKQQIIINTQILLQIKKQFQLFKSLIIQQLNRQKQYIRQSVKKIYLQIQSKRWQIREEVREEIELNKQGVRDSVRGSRKTSTQLNYEDMLKINHLQVDTIVGLKGSSQADILTFGVIDQQSLQVLALNGIQKQEPIQQQTLKNVDFSENQPKNKSNKQVSQQQVVSDICQNFSQHNLSHHVMTQKQIQKYEDKCDDLIKQLKYCRSSQDLINSNNISQYKNHNPNIIKPQISSLYSIASSSKQTIPNAKNVEEGQENRKYNQLLKKYNHPSQSAYISINKNKPSTSSGISSQNGSDKEKLHDRMNHIQKFYGAMQKLKSQIKQIKNISDTKDLKRIKFSQRETQSQLKQIKMNEMKLEN